MKKTTTLVVGALLASACTAFAQSNGDVIYTTSQGEIGFVDGDSFGPQNLLFDFDGIGETDARLARIIQEPLTGDYFVADGRLPFANLDSGIWRVQDLLTGAGTASQVTSGNPLQNPIGLAFDFQRGSLINASNPGVIEQNGPAINGIFEVATDGSSVAQLYSSDAAVIEDDRPFLEGLSDIVNDFNSTDLFAIGVNGGVLNPMMPDQEGSTLFRLSRNPMTGQYEVEDEALVDFSASATGLPNSYQSIRGVATVPGVDAVFVVDTVLGEVLRIDLDANGDAAGITTILGGLDEPSVLQWNPFTQQFVLVDEGTPSDANRIVTFDLDGSGLEVLTELPDRSQLIRGLSIIGADVPAPGAFALAGLAGLAGLRRRRK